MPPPRATTLLRPQHGPRPRPMNMHAAPYPSVALSRQPLSARPQSCPDRSFFVEHPLVRVLCLLAISTTPLFTQAPDDDSIAYVDHGAFFDRKGREIEPTPQFIASARGWVCY